MKYTKLVIIPTNDIKQDFFQKKQKKTFFIYLDFIVVVYFLLIDNTGSRVQKLAYESANKDSD